MTPQAKDLHGFFIRLNNTVSNQIPKQELRFTVDDERHCHRMGQYKSFEEARIAIVGFVTNPWNHDPNRAPCRNWENCGRDYSIIETNENGEYVSTTPVCKIDSEGVIWLNEGVPDQPT